MNSLNRNIAKEEVVVVLKAKYYKGDENARKFKCERRTQENGQGIREILPR